MSKDIRHDEMTDLISDVAEAMLDFPAWKQKWIPVWQACLRMNTTKEEALAGFKYCLMIDKQMKEEKAQDEKAALATFVAHSMKKVS